MAPFMLGWLPVGVPPQVSTISGALSGGGPIVCALWRRLHKGYYYKFHCALFNRTAGEGGLVAWITGRRRWHRFPSCTVQILAIIAYGSTCTPVRWAKCICTRVPASERVYVHVNYARAFLLPALGGRMERRVVPRVFVCCRCALRIGCELCADHPAGRPPVRPCWLAGEFIKVWSRARRKSARASTCQARGVRVIEVYDVFARCGGACASN